MMSQRRSRAETTPLGNFFYRQFGHLKKVFCPRYTQIDDPLNRAFPSHLQESPAQRSGAHVSEPGEMRNRKRPVQLLLDQLNKVRQERHLRLPTSPIDKRGCPPSRCGATTRRFATLLATDAPKSLRMMCRQRSI